MKVYIYPTYTPSRDKSGNLYIKYFHDAFEHADGVKVKNRLWQVGILSILFNLDSDVFIIQWVDLLPHKRLGKIQSIIYFALVLILKLLNKKIIWILHNKRSHQGASKWVDATMVFMAKYSSRVITHSAEGITFYNDKYPSYKGKCVYIPHPVYETTLYPSKSIKYDYIIWGNISKRKNVLEFVDYASHSDFFKQKQILICGYCGDSIYDKAIKDHITPNITYLNKFLSDEELASLISESSTILFTYNTGSVLSSGALIYSLNFSKNIIGPRAGSFADLKDIVQCYDKFSDIEHIQPMDNHESIREYIANNTWNTFPQKLLKQI